MTRLEINNQQLERMFSAHEVLDADGEPVPVQENVVVEFANALYRLVRRERPHRVLEVGMAHGATALAILTALTENGETAHLTSIDPFQQTDWQGIGRLNVERSGFADMHTLLCDYDYLALPRLMSSGETFDFAYIDGWHNFEYALLDFFYVDKMLDVGGVVGFNDCDWLPVRSVLNFVERHRDYEQVDAGLPPLYGGRASWAHKARRLDRRLSRGRITGTRPVGRLLGRRRDDRYYRKRSATERPHGFWAPV
jgi:predicted O-methyltransferase YrrM